MRKLVKVPDSKLRRQSKPVKKIDNSVKRLAKDMEKFMLQRQDNKARPVGLAAVQMGELIRMFAFLSNPDEEKQREVIFLINPEIIREKGSHIVSEGCLSIPGKVFKLRRSKIVKIRGLTLDGEIRTFRGSDLLAQVFQHEVDHLNGILIDAVGKEIKT